MELKQGVVVALMSGGPDMTISKVIGTDTNNIEDMAYARAGYKIGDLVCIWFSGSKQESGVFSPHVVKIK